MDELMINWSSTIQTYLLCLAKAVRTVHGLEIHSRVPITLVKDNSVCCSQVYPQTSCSCTQQENKNVWPAQGSQFICKGYRIHLTLGNRNNKFLKNVPMRKENNFTGAESPSPYHGGP
jgi:hypothetical protein